MLDAANLIFSSLQIAAVVVVLAAVAQGRPAGDLDRGALGQLLTDSTRYLDPQTTGSIGRLIDSR